MSSESKENERGWRLRVVERLGERLRAIEVWDLEHGKAGWYVAAIQSRDRKRLFIGERIISVPYEAIDKLRRWGECGECCGSGSVDIGPHLGCVACAECHGAGYREP
jgi:hypothetical protein